MDADEFVHGEPLYFLMVFYIIFVFFCLKISLLLKFHYFFTYFMSHNKYYDKLRVSLPMFINSAQVNVVRSVLAVLFANLK